MNLSTFKQSFSTNTPPDSLSVYTKALWYDAKGDWKKAHSMVDSLSDKNGSWVHAYLHRVEGDISNADYWYHKAGKKRPHISLQQEWEQLAEALL